MNFISIIWKNYSDYMPKKRSIFSLDNRAERVRQLIDAIRKLPKGNINRSGKGREKTETTRIFLREQYDAELAKGTITGSAQKKAAKFRLVAFLATSHIKPRIRRKEATSLLARILVNKEFGQVEDNVELYKKLENDTDITLFDAAKIIENADILYKRHLEDYH
jgi:hypothetical protein